MAGFITYWPKEYIKNLKKLRMSVEHIEEALDVLLLKSPPYGVVQFPTNGDLLAFFDILNFSNKYPMRFPFTLLIDWVYLWF